VADLKLITAPAANWMANSNDPETYALNKRGQFREFVRDSNTWGVKLWASWYNFQQEWGNSVPPSQRDEWWESWNQLRTGPYNAGIDPNSWAILDDQIVQANVDQKAVFLGIYPHYPTWTFTVGPSDEQANKEFISHWPDGRGTDSPYGWFVAYVLARYKPGAPVNATGPNTNGNYFGNPRGAWLNALEPLNEPNYMCWPQRVSNTFPAACNSADMLVTAYQYTQAYAASNVIGPGTTDEFDPVGTASYNYSPRMNELGVDWWTFSSDVIANLQNKLNPNWYLGWSHHNYRDVRGQSPGGSTPNPNQATNQRGYELGQLLRARGYPWPGFWVTEGGYRMTRNAANTGLAAGEAERHRSLIESGRFVYRFVPDAFTFAQYGVNDGAYAYDPFQSSMREPFQGDPATTGVPGPERPAGAAWRAP
jgi:hypothetical protein